MFFKRATTDGRLFRESQVDLRSPTVQKIVSLLNSLQKFLKSLYKKQDPW